jgi:Transcriptional regulators
VDKPLGSSSQLVEDFKELSSAYSLYSTNAFFRFAKSKELSPSQLGTLLHLKKDRAQGVAGLGDKMSVTSAAASQMIDRLVQAGFVERAEDEEDRRAKLISLTGKGEKTIEEFGRERQAWIRSLAKRLSPEESAILQEALRIVIEKSKDINKEFSE